MTFPSESFAVGEVAIYWLPGNCRHNTEVTIASRLYETTYRGPEGLRIGFVYDVDAPGYRSGTRVAEAHCLRKRRPPQDWKTLCKLDEVPSDCVAEQEVCT